MSRPSLHHMYDQNNQLGRGNYDRDRGNRAHDRGNKARDRDKQQLGRGKQASDRREKDTDRDKKLGRGKSVRDRVDQIPDRGLHIPDRGLHIGQTSGTFRDHLIGTVRFLISNILDDDSVRVTPCFSAVQIRRPSGRFHGVMNIRAMLSFRDSHDEEEISAIGYRDLMGEKIQLNRKNPELELEERKLMS
ncbi:unnamed protein product [Lupinus luteus]|uniref:Uncharacterized protein n=1 Tax=Lupinus luteus TaxID=3873 RepID=A0AAV1XAP2_LUPLU